MKPAKKRLSITNIINRSVAISITILVSLCVYVVTIVQVLRVYQSKYLNEVYASKYIGEIRLELKHIDEHLKTLLADERVYGIEHMNEDVSELRKIVSLYSSFAENEDIGVAGFENFSREIKSILNNVITIYELKSNNQLERVYLLYNETYLEMYTSVTRYVREASASHKFNSKEYVNIRDRVEDRGVVVFVVIVILLCILIGFNKKRLVRGIFIPLGRLEHAIRKITDGDYGFKVNEEYNNELGDLCHIINLMSVEVLKSRNSLLEAKAETEKFHTQLSESHRMASIGVMSSGIAHELSQPLGVILLKSQLISVLLDKKQYDKVRKEYSNIESQVLRAKKIIDSLRIISREGKVEEKEKEDKDVNMLLKDVVTLFYDDFRLSKIKVLLDLIPENPCIHVSQVQFCQVIANLLSNAKDAVFNISNPEITIRSAIEDRNVYVSITDNGAGIPGDHLSRIFEPFYTLKDVGKGTGLGLSLCHRMIKDNGGNITVDSTVGKGSTFTLSFPVSA